MCKEGYIFYIKICVDFIYTFLLELSEDKSLAIGQNAEDGAAITAEDDQTTFDVKYLGNTPVDSAAGAVSEAVKTISTMVSNTIEYINFFLNHYHSTNVCFSKMNYTCSTQNS